MPEYYSWRRRSAQADDSASRLVENVAGRIRADAQEILDIALDRRAVETLVERHYRWHPMRGATQREAAIHEAGHYVGYEVVGMQAAVAELFSPRRGETEWSGRASAWDMRPRDREGYTPDILRADLVATLAGPIAEALLTPEGDPLSSLPELVEARFVAEALADMTNRAAAGVFFLAALRAASMVERHAAGIEQCAARLMTRRRILEWESRRVATMIRGWRRPPPNAIEYSPTSLALVRCLAAAVDPLAALVARRERIAA
jgi:hypothetical protein